MKRTKNTLILNLLIVFSAVVFFFVVVAGNVGVIKSKVAVIPGSYGEKYAKENKLKIVTLSDNQQEYFDFRYETFEFSNGNSGGYDLENYSGVSKTLVIPSAIEGIEVKSLSENFIKSLTDVKDIYISESVTSIKGDPDKNIVIHCYEDSTFYKNYADGEWNIEIILASDYVNFDLGKIPFNYNFTGDSYQITQYIGNEDYIIIPSYINGYPVSDVSMSFLNTNDVIVIPETVSSISGETSKLLYSAVFAIEMIFTLMAFVLGILAVNILLPRYNKSNMEYMLTGNQMVTVVAYIVMQVVFAIYSIYKSTMDAYTALIVSVIILVVFMAATFLGGTGRKQVIAVSENIEKKTSRMDSLKEATKYLADGIADPELKKQVQRLVDEIRYSDPVSSSELEGVENEIGLHIDELKHAIKDNNTNEIQLLVNNILETVKERNERSKRIK